MVEATKLSKIDKILWAARLLLHTEEGLQSQDSHRNTRRNLLRLGGAELDAEVKRFGDEQVNRCVAVKITVEAQHHHPFLRNPTLPLLRVSKGIRGYWHAGPVSELCKRCKCVANQGRLKLDDKVEILCLSAVSVRCNSKPADDNERHAGFIQCPNNGFDARELQLTPFEPR